MTAQKIAGLRFDIDTISDIRNGLPALLDILNRYEAKATFFVTVGRSASFIENVKDIDRSIANLTGGKEPSDGKKLSGFKKLGLRGFLETVIFNPLLGPKGREILLSAKEAGHELALHGGKNHAAWARGAANWPIGRIEEEIWWGRHEFEKIFGFCPAGFSTPGFVVPKYVDAILVKAGFRYHSGAAPDDDQARRRTSLKEISVNVCSSGGIPIIEHFAALGKEPEYIVNYFKERFRYLRSAAITPVFYGHPAVEGWLCGDIFEKVLKDLADDKWIFSELVKI